MRNKIHDAFNDIKAEEKLKLDTLTFLQEKMNRKNRFNVKRFAAVLASIFILLFAGGLSYNLYFSASAYVDIDVNPSIELTLNRFERVIEVYAYNEDGNDILAAVNIKYKAYDEAINILIDEMFNKGYIADVGLFSATLQTRNDATVLLDNIQVSVSSSLHSHHTTLEQDIFTVDSETKTLAHEMNLSPAKYLAILEFQSVDPTVVFEDCKDHTISEIKQQTHDHMQNDENVNNHDENHSNQSNNETNEHTGSDNNNGHNGSGGNHDNSK